MISNPARRLLKVFLKAIPVIKIHPHRRKIIGIVGTPQISKTTRMPVIKTIILALFDATGIKDCNVFVLLRYDLISRSLKIIKVHTKENTKILTNPSLVSLLIV